MSRRCRSWEIAKDESEERRYAKPPSRDLLILAALISASLAIIGMVVGLWAGAWSAEFAWKSAQLRDRARAGMVAAKVLPPTGPIGSASPQP